jgi:hypothetical protein
LRVIRRTTAKRGRRPDENEDSSAEKAATGRFAVSDGASTAARADVWSALLTDAFVRGDDPLAPHTLAVLRRQWWKSVFHKDLPWFAHEKLARGSAATFIGLRIWEGCYEVVAVGDSCLFHLRKEEILLTAPMGDWTQFSRFPDLLSTDAAAPPTGDQVWTGGGEFIDGDVFVLATDAVAKHMLRTHAERGIVLPVCDYVTDDATFVDFIERERERGLDNDDATVCVVQP